MVLLVVTKNSSLRLLCFFVLGVLFARFAAQLGVQKAGRIQARV
jgi:hypothetical protein